MRSEYNHSAEVTTLTFQSAKFKDRYLVKDIKKGKIRLSYPQDDNHLFQLTLIGSRLYVALKDKDGCFMAFSRSGDRLPCQTSPENQTAHLILNMVKFDSRPLAKG